MFLQKLLFVFFISYVHNARSKKSLPQPLKKCNTKIYYNIKIEGGKHPLLTPTQKPNKIHPKIFDNLNLFFQQKQKSTEKFSADFLPKKYFYFFLQNFQNPVSRGNIWAYNVCGRLTCRLCQSFVCLLQPLLHHDNRRRLRHN